MTTKKQECSLGGVAYKGRRSFLDEAYHYCARCGTRVPISDLEWQYGLLVCKIKDCVDYGNDGVPLIGQREAAVARAIQEPTDELMPLPKLVDNEETSSSSELDIVY